MNQRTPLQHSTLNKTRSQAGLLSLGMIIILLLTPALGAPQSNPGRSSTPPAPGPKTFPSAREAADALIQAAEKIDVPTLIEIFGAENKDLVVTEDEVQAKNAIAAFAERAKERIVLKPDPKNKKLVILSVGNEDWPMPIPIVKENDKWRFDVSSGRKEILYRLIGENELDTIQICRGFVEAQHEYALQKHAGFEVNQYAQRIISTPGAQDGLAWKNPDGTWGGPVGENIARAIEEGYADEAKPYHGYYFKILTGQGPAAPLGELNYVIKGVMIGGFALVAAPADYRVTGVKTFMVSQDGVVYEKDLGPDTLKVFQAMTRFNPDESWTPVLEE